MLREMSVVMVCTAGAEGDICRVHSSAYVVMHYPLGHSSTVAHKYDEPDKQYVSHTCRMESRVKRLEKDESEAVQKDVILDTTPTHLPCFRLFCPLDSTASPATPRVGTESFR